MFHTNVPRPQMEFQIIYNTTNITQDVTASLRSLVYTDNISGASDEIAITLEDVRGLWANSWYPGKGDTLTVSIEGVPCGIFTIDEIELSGPPDSVTVRGLAAGIKNTLRTKRSVGYENKTLRQICTKVAERNGFTVSGTVANIQIERATQFRETDLEFLARIAREYGFEFSVRGSQITFTDSVQLETAKPVAELKKTDVISYSFVDKTANTFKSAKVDYKNPNSGKVVAFGYDVTEFVNKAYSAIEKLDVLSIKSKAENDIQAEAKAKSALRFANMEGKTARITTPLNMLLVAGNTVQLLGFNVLDGGWQIKSSTHTLDSNGFTTSLELQKIS